MQKTLGKKFFERPAPEVAEDLIGKQLIRKWKDGKKERFIITETEAYEGLDDLASHASKGRTPRTEIMFGEAGVFYIYLVYGMYYMLNIVTGPHGHPSGVLIRAIQRLKDRKIERLENIKKEKLDGPGKITRELSIDKKLNGKKAGKESGLWFEDRGERPDKMLISKTPRIGVSYAGPVWSKKLWRFVYRR